MNADELREKYLDFFASRGHRRCESDVLVPTWDPSVLFTPAGMNQFKDHFLGKVKLEFTRATSCQKCLRTGDIENVGRTAYHHTFFEMLGNFSFGDYFKREAIHWAWEFLTSKLWLGIDPDRLSVSVYLEDDEAAEIWLKEVGLPANRLQRLGEHDNFWPAGAPSEGPDGVCGPCSEVFFHDEFGDEVEIWNLVFTQFNRVGGPPDNLQPLPSKNIDTGMGLERAAACLQRAETNFHIDILRPILDAAADVCGIRYEFKSENGRRLRRITDHVRACTMAIHENVYPGAQKEKYVIRRLLRRAILDGHQMGLREPFLHLLVPAVVQTMKRPYPDLVETQERVAGVMRTEEANFFETIDAGLARIERIFADMRARGRERVDGAEAADLYQTFGVPPELLETMAAENNLAFDWDGYRRAMEEHGEVSGRQAHVVMGDRGPIDAIKKVLHETRFLGYDTVEAEAEVKFLIAQDRLCDHVREVGHDRPLTVVLDQSPFYGEAGGQVGDSGVLVGDRFRLRVRDTQKDGQLILHHGHLESGELHTGARVTARVDAERRDAIRRAHSATHMLHHALQKHLGSHAQQQGSKVDEDWLRFDFANMAPVTPEQLASIEADVAARIAAADPISWKIVPLAEARAEGAMMLFGEKYPDPVRMVSMGEFSKELCGGTHLANTREVEQFECVSEEGIAAGTRRIVALTGLKAADFRQQVRDQLDAVARCLDVPPADVCQAIRALVGRVRELKKRRATGAVAENGRRRDRHVGQTPEPTYEQLREELRRAARVLNVPLLEVAQRVQGLLAEEERLRREMEQLAEAADEVSAAALLERAERVGKTAVVVAQVPGGDPNLMRQLIDQIRQRAGSSAVLLAATRPDSTVTLVAGVSRDLVQQGVSAGDWVQAVAPLVGGGGGGRADMAQAGGKLPERILDALAKALQFIRAALNPARTP
jgi:alanyl-tRNA synthetase